MLLRRQIIPYREMVSPVFGRLSVVRKLVFSGTEMIGHDDSQNHNRYHFFHPVHSFSFVRDSF